MEVNEYRSKILDLLLNAPEEVAEMLLESGL